MGFNRGRNPWQPGPIFRHAFEVARCGGEPRLCFIATAGGDQAKRIECFYRAFAGTAVRCSHLALFDKPNVADVRGHLLSHDVVWVDRGSVANLLAVWRTHGVDEALRECWRSGVVLAGESAGSLCWHRAGLTDSFGDLRVFTNGLSLLPYSNSVHYHERRDLVHRSIADATMPAGYATDAGAALHFRGTELIEALADRKDAGAYRLALRADGSVEEQRLNIRRLRS